MARWEALLVATITATIIGCGSSDSGDDIADASADASGATDAGGSRDAGASDADSPSPRCKDGLPDAPTNGVTCGTTECASGESCCIGDDSGQCVADCPNLRLNWVCDRSAHCGTGKVCCFEAPLLSFDSCPGTSVNMAPLCEDSSKGCDSIACQTDADCAGKTCYAVSVGGERTIGVCH
jgi:hypothetical protein